MAPITHPILDQLHKPSISLRAHRAPLRLPQRTIFGAWDPLLRRIDIYACDDSRSDRELVQTLLHELAHAQSRSRDETAIRELAHAHLAQLTEEEIADLATHLRHQATHERECGHSARTSIARSGSCGQNAHTPQSTEHAP